MAAQTPAITSASQMESLPVIRKEKRVKKGRKSHMILLLIFYRSELNYMATLRAREVPGIMCPDKNWSSLSKEEMEPGYWG